MQNLSDIAVFVEVVGRGSFTAAADALEISKAAVSKYVSRLEDRLGARLLNRTTRRLTLTEAGAVLYDQAQAALAELKAAESGVLELSGAPRGRLRVTAPAYFGNAFLMPIVSRFLSDYPEISIDLDLDNRIVDVVEQRFDVAVRITTLTDSSLVARRLSEVGLVTVASPAYLARHGTPTQPHQLGDHVALTYSIDRTPNEWSYRDKNGAALAVRVRGCLRCNNDDALKQAALDGVGIARFPEIFVAAEIDDGRLVRILDAFEPLPSSLCAVFPSRANLAPKVRVFVDYLAQHLRTS